MLLSSIGAVYVEFYDSIVHSFGLGEANRTAIESLQMGPKIQVLPFNALRSFFADAMLFGW